MLQIVIDPIFPSKYEVERILGEENLFELLYSETENGLENKRLPFTTPIYPVASLAQPLNKDKLILEGNEIP